MKKTSRADAMALILTGSRAKQTEILYHLRAKSCMPFVGSFQLVDYVLSNCHYS